MPPQALVSLRTACVRCVCIVGSAGAAAAVPASWHGGDGHRFQEPGHRGHTCSNGEAHRGRSLFSQLQAPLACVLLLACMTKFATCHQLCNNHNAGCAASHCQPLRQHHLAVPKPRRGSGVGGVAALPPCRADDRCAGLACLTLTWCKHGRNPSADLEVDVWPQPLWWAASMCWWTSPWQ